MEFIDKSKPEFKDNAHAIIKKFIDEQWQEDANQYVNLTYESFNSRELKDLLLSEQGRRCCYCLKCLSDKESTIEHIIPNKVADPASFSDYDEFGEISTNVFVWMENKRFVKINTPPFPHIIAYENLVVSCNGYIPYEGNAKCCNNKRGMKTIIPLFYIPNVKEEFQYDEKGIIVCHEKYYDTIQILGLENHTLQLFRRCWLNLPANYGIKDVYRANTDGMLRKEIVDDMDFVKVSLSDRTTILNQIYWNTFKNYCYFYRYNQAGIANGNNSINQSANYTNISTILARD